MLLINLDDQKQGLAIIDGVSYRVTGTYGLRGQVIYPYTSNRRSLTIELVLNDTLDEEQQRKRIERLEMDLQHERERLDEIRCTLNGDDERPGQGGQP